MSAIPYPPSASKSQFISTRERILHGNIRRSLDGWDGQVGGYMTEPESAGKSVWRFRGWTRRLLKSPTKGDDGASRLTKKNGAPATVASCEVVADDAAPDPTVNVQSVDHNIMRTGSLPDGSHGPGYGPVGHHGQYVQRPDGRVVHSAAAGDIPSTIQHVLEPEPPMQMAGSGNCEQAEPRGSTPASPPVFQQGDPPSQVIIMNKGIPDFPQDTLKPFAIQLDEAAARQAVVATTQSVPTSVVAVTEVHLSAEPLYTPGPAADARGPGDQSASSMAYDDGGCQGLDNLGGSTTAAVNNNATTYDACSRCEETHRRWKNIEYDWDAVYNQQVATQEGLERQVADLKAMLAERASPRQPRGSGGVGLLPDTEVLARWTGLGWAIRQCVDHYMREPAQISAEVLDHLRHLTPYYKHFLSDRQSACLLAEGVIWHQLAHDVFAREKALSWMLWAGQHSKHLTKLADATWQSAASTTDREFHTWRSHTSTFIASSASAAEVEASAEQLAERVMGKLKHVLRGWKSAGLRAAVVKLMLQAIQLDGDLCQQRAWWFAQYPSCGAGQGDFDFDPATMKVLNNLEPEAAVVLIVSPALVKAGDARGEYYDSSVVIAKSEVCGLPSASAGRRTSTPSSQTAGGKRVGWR